MNFQKSSFFPPFFKGPKTLMVLSLPVVPVFVLASGGDMYPQNQGGADRSIYFERRLEGSSVPLCSGTNSQKLLNDLTDTPWRWNSNPAQAFNTTKSGCQNLSLKKHIEELPNILRTTHNLITSHDRVLFFQKIWLKQNELQISNTQKTLDEFLKQIEDLKKNQKAKREELRDFEFNTRRRSKYRGHRRLKPWTLAKMEADITEMGTQIQNLQKQTPRLQEQLKNYNQHRKTTLKNLKKLRSHLNSTEVQNRFEALKERSKDIIKDFSKAFEKGCFKNADDEVKVFSRLVSLSEMFLMKNNKASIIHLRPATELLAPLASEQVLRSLQKKSSAPPSRQALFLKTLECMKTPLLKESQKCEEEQKSFQTEARATCTTGNCPSPQDNEWEGEGILKLLTNSICNQQKGMTYRLTQASQNRLPSVVMQSSGATSPPAGGTGINQADKQDTSSASSPAVASSSTTAAATTEPGAIQDTELPGEANNTQDSNNSSDNPVGAAAPAGQGLPVTSDSSFGRDAVAPQESSQKKNPQPTTPSVSGKRRKGFLGFMGRILKRTPKKQSADSSGRGAASLEDQIQEEVLRLNEDVSQRNRSRRPSIRNYYKKRIRWRERKIKRLQKQMKEL